MTGAIDLSQVPAPDVVETIDFEDILSEMIADLTARDPAMGDIGETDPAMKILEVAAFRETLLRQRVNEAAQAVMLPYAAGADLDNLAAALGVERLVITPADPETIPPTPAVYESDADLRRRAQLAPDALSVAGPESAYVFHALSADGQVLDAGAYSPNPGDVLVTVLARDGDGTADTPLLDTVTAAVAEDENVRPLTDHVTIQSATIVDYTINATIYTYEGPDSSVVMDNAHKAIRKYVDSMHRLGYDVTLSGIYAALHQAGAQHVELTAPAATLVISKDEASYCTDITLTYGGHDE